MKRKYTANRAVALRIVEIINEQKISQYELAKRADLSTSTLNNIINETHKSCTITTLEKIIFGLGMEFTQFFDSPLFDHDKFNN